MYFLKVPDVFTVVVYRLSFFDHHSLVGQALLSACHATQARPDPVSSSCPGNRYVVQLPISFLPPCVFLPQRRSSIRSLYKTQDSRS